MEKSKVIYCDTKPTAEGIAVRTKFTLDLAGLEDKDILDYALDAMVIKWQSAARRNVKKGTKIPAETTYIVPKPGTRGAVAISKEQALKVILGTGYDAALAKFGDLDKLYTAFQALMAEPAVNTTQDAADEIGEMDAPDEVEVEEETL